MAAGVQVTVGATQNPLPQAMAPKLEEDLDRIHRQRADPTDASLGSASRGTVNKARLALARIWRTAAAAQHVDHATDACSISSVTQAVRAE
jgi:hypothetical protein